MQAYKTFIAILHSLLLPLYLNFALLLQQLTITTVTATDMPLARPLPSCDSVCPYGSIVLTHMSFGEPDDICVGHCARLKRADRETAALCPSGAVPICGYWNETSSCSAGVDPFCPPGFYRAMIEPFFGQLVCMKTLNIREGREWCGPGWNQFLCAQINVGPIITNTTSCHSSTTTFCSTSTSTSMTDCSTSTTSTSCSCMSNSTITVSPTETLSTNTTSVPEVITSVTVMPTEGGLVPIVITTETCSSFAVTVCGGTSTTVSFPTAVTVTVTSTVTDSADKNMAKPLNDTIWNGVVMCGILFLTICIWF